MNELEHLVTIAGAAESADELEDALLGFVRARPSASGDLLYGALRLVSFGLVQAQRSECGIGLDDGLVSALASHPGFELRHAHWVAGHWSSLEYAPSQEAASTVLELAEVSPLVAVLLGFSLMVDDQYQWSERDRANLMTAAALPPAQFDALAHRLMDRLVARSWWSDPGDGLDALLQWARSL